MGDYNPNFPGAKRPGVETSPTGPKYPGGDLPSQPGNDPVAEPGGWGGGTMSGPIAPPNNPPGRFRFPTPPVTLPGNGPVAAPGSGVPDGAGVAPPPTGFPGRVPEGPRGGVRGPGPVIGGGPSPSGPTSGVGLGPVNGLIPTAPPVTYTPPPATYTPPPSQKPPVTYPPPTGNMTSQTNANRSMNAPRIPPMQGGTNDWYGRNAPQGSQFTPPPSAGLGAGNQFEMQKRKKAFPQA